jgi:hypothetical protein
MYLKETVFVDVDWNILDLDRIQRWILVNTAVEISEGLLHSEERLSTLHLVIRLTALL